MWHRNHDDKDEYNVTEGKETGRYVCQLSHTALYRQLYVAGHGYSVGFCVTRSLNPKWDCLFEDASLAFVQPGTIWKAARSFQIGWLGSSCAFCGKPHRVGGTRQETVALFLWSAIHATLQCHQRSLVVFWGRSLIGRISITAPTLLLPLLLLVSLRLFSEPGPNLFTITHWNGGHSIIRNPGMRPESRQAHAERSNLKWNLNSMVTGVKTRISVGIHLLFSLSRTSEMYILTRMWMICTRNT